MAAFRIAVEMIPDKSIKAIEILPHIRRAGCYIDTRRRSKPEHRLRPVQYGQQTLQRPRIEATANFNPPAVARFNYQHTVTMATCLFRNTRNYFNGKHRRSVWSRHLTRPPTVFIQCRYRQATLLTERIPPQPAGLEIGNQLLYLNPTTPPPHNCHFAHNPSAPPNAAAQQSALL